MKLVNTSLTIATTKYESVKEFYAKGLNMNVEMELPIMTVLSSEGLHLVVSKGEVEPNQAFELTYTFNTMAEIDSVITKMQANNGKLMVRLSEEELKGDEQSPAAIVMDPLENEILLYLTKE